MIRIIKCAQPIQTSFSQYLLCGAFETYFDDEIQDILCAQHFMHLRYAMMNLFLPKVRWKKPVQCDTFVM